MKNKRILAVFLSVIMAAAMCMPLGGMSAYAAENTEIVDDQAVDEEESVPSESEQDPEIAEAPTESESVDVQEDPITAEETNEEEPPEEQDITEQVEDAQEAVSDSEAANESTAETATEEEYVEEVTEEPTAQEDETDEIIEPEQLEEESEAAADGSTRGNVAQAIYTDGNKTFTFYYGPLVSVGQSFKGNTVTNVWSGKDVTDSGSDYPKWFIPGKKGPVQETVSAVFDESFLAVKPTSLYAWFEQCYDLTSIDFSGLDSSNVTNMSCMFEACGGLTSLDLSKLDTSKVTDMSNMFYVCRNLTSLDLRTFDTSKVTDMSNMFCFLENLTSLDISSFNTSNVTSMYRMFYGCSSLESLDLSKFDTSKVTNMSQMFSFLHNVKSLDLSRFDTSNVTNMFEMFCWCESLTSLDLSKFDTSSATSMSSMFIHCENLESVDLSHFNTSNVEYMNSMFSYCKSLTSLDLSGFDTSNVDEFDYMFDSCSNLKTIYCRDSKSDWKSRVVNDYLFDECTSLVGTDGDAKVVFNENWTGSYMARSASLGGYFTPKSSTEVKLGKTTRGDMFNLANNVKVTWKAVPGAKYYKVYREGITNPKETQTEPVIVTTGLVGWDKSAGLTNGNAYRYKIVASLTGKGDSSGDSPLSYSKVMYRLKTVVIRSVKNTAAGKVTVKYDKTTSGDSYVLQYCERQDMVGAKTKVVLGANNTSYTIGGLKKGKTYYISIRVRKKVNGIDYYTTFGVPKKVVITK